ncbi:4-hydroxybenzoate octaprenyltransferase [Atopomonas sediminilitoris]|uniref:4-hydroxybenzoate octaprenyltransferase n=1 Tax=Atopomonas sediminilitoris TaxID=2919919 RepID=UPI001F4D5FDD|nr:4-hydroxybenzoate octaprenyltransferase [Atopomonas sediminilitoris]
MYVTLLQQFNRLHPRAYSFIELMRLERPIGIYLLLWPTLWALWVAAEGMPSSANLIIFIAGVVVMRSAGCVINDYADRHLDGHVARTRERPLASGRVQPKEALILFAVLIALAFGLVLFTNLLTIGLAFGGALLAALYPFMKRYTFYPQVVLGAAFSWSMPMAFAAESQSLTPQLWLLYLANLLWTVAYDTQYAMCDREDDLKVGIKSTAILFGDADRLMIGLLQGMAALCLIIVASQLKLGGYFYAGLAGMLLTFAWQHWLIRDRQPAACLRAFLNNHISGLLLFIGLVADYALRATQ